MSPVPQGRRPEPPALLPPCRSPLPCREPKPVAHHGDLTSAPPIDAHETLTVPPCPSSRRVREQITGEAKGAAARKAAAQRVRAAQARAAPPSARKISQSPPKRAIENKPMPPAASPVRATEARAERRSSRSALVRSSSGEAPSYQHSLTVGAAAAKAAAHAAAEAVRAVERAKRAEACVTFTRALEQVARFLYNHDGFTYSIDKSRNVGDLLQQGAVILQNRSMFGRIQCVEAVFVGLLLTQECFHLTRFGVSFETVAGERAHRHLVLGVLCGDYFGALGLSRGKGLGSKPMVFGSLLDMLRDYQRCYREEGHDVSAVVLGRPIPHLMTCGKVCWGFARIAFRPAEEQQVVEACSKYERHLRGVAAAAQLPPDCGGSPKTQSSFSSLRHSFPPHRSSRILQPLTPDAGLQPDFAGGVCSRGPFAPLQLQKKHKPAEDDSVVMARCARVAVILAAAVAAALPPQRKFVWGVRPVPSAGAVRPVPSAGRRPAAATTATPQ